MKEMIRFFPIEIISHAWFLEGTKKCNDVEILSIILVPRGVNGQPIISEVPFPEIFLQ